MSAKEFKEQIASKLTEAGFEFELEPALGGLQPDFLVQGPGGQLVVVEAKAWDPRGGNTARALEHVERYREVTGADRAFVVLPDLKKNFESRGVVSLKTLLTSLKDVFDGPARRSRMRLPSRLSEENVVFAAMPFARKYDDTFFVAMTHAAKKVGAICKRVDRTEFTGDVVQEVRRLIALSVAVIVDLSESKPNVLYEAGYAHALSKPSVHICSSPLDELPFDVRNWNTLPYSIGQTSGLRDPLTRRLKAAITRSERLANLDTNRIGARFK
ncbi:hypothetical protein MJD09_13150 [bacterium]|nr:hypothetical protein [bacterium]